MVSTAYTIENTAQTVENDRNTAPVVGVDTIPAIIQSTIIILLKSDCFITTLPIELAKYS
jgi:hypothetical protein